MAKVVKMMVIGRVRVPYIGDYLHVRGPGGEYYLAGGRMKDGRYYDPLASITIPAGSVVETPVVQREVDVELPPA